jgi:Ribbon-helix-helix protein, copG family
MAKPKKLSVRLTEDDNKLLNRLIKKLGVAESQIVRLAFRALATKEGVAA